MKFRRAILSFVLGLFALIGVAGCEALGLHRSMRADTGDASNISALSAKLSGRAHLPGTIMTDLSFGIVFSKDESFPVDNTIQRMATSADSDYKYSVYATALEPETTYYYRSFISQNGETAYGETRSFTTPGVSTLIKTLAPSDITASSVTLNAFLDQNCAGPLSAWGFRIENNGQQILVGANNRSDNGFSLSYSTYSETDYTVTAYVSTHSYKPASEPNTYIVDGVKTYYASETIPFTTKAIEATLTLDEVTEVSETQARLSGSLATSWRDYVIHIDIIYSPSASTIDELKSSGIVAGYYCDYEKGTFWANLRELQPGTEYYWAVVAHVGDATFESEVKTFHTAGYSAEITSSSADSVSFTYATLTGKLTVTSVEPLSKETWFLYSATSTTLDDLISSGIKVTASLDDTGTMTAKVEGFFDGTTYYFVPAAKILDKIYFGTVSSFTTDSLPTGAVDLGVALLWASCNVGASSPYESGSTFSWGETVPRTTESWAEYSLCSPGDGLREWVMNKYCVQSSYGKVDNKRVLELIDDAAYMNLHGHWRMPTDAEWQKLMNPSKCKWVRTKMGDTVGYIVTGIRTGKSIFIPAICYWSSSLYTTQSNQAWTYDVYYYDPEYYNYYPGSYEIGLCRAPLFRCFAFGVRAVMPFSD